MKFPELRVCRRDRAEVRTRDALAEPRRVVVERRGDAAVRRVGRRLAGAVVGDPGLRRVRGAVPLGPAHQLPHHVVQADRLPRRRGGGGAGLVHLLRRRRPDLVGVRRVDDIRHRRHAPVGARLAQHPAPRVVGVGGVVRRPARVVWLAGAPHPPPRVVARVAADARRAVERLRLGADRPPELVEIAPRRRPDGRRPPDRRLLDPHHRRHRLRPRVRRGHHRRARHHGAGMVGRANLHVAAAAQVLVARVAAEPRTRQRGTLDTWQYRINGPHFRLPTMPPAALPADRRSAFDIPATAESIGFRSGRNLASRPSPARLVHGHRRGAVPPPHVAGVPCLHIKVDNRIRVCQSSNFFMRNLRRLF